MSNIDRSNQTDSRSLSIGEIRSGTGRARQTLASKPRYVLGEHPIRTRGTPESNPLYDAFDSDRILPQRQTQNNFRPITPPRFTQNLSDHLENTYDQPRSFGFDNEPKPAKNPRRKHHPAPHRKAVESSPNSEADLLMDKVESELPAAIDDVEACRVDKRHRRRRILYNLFDFLAILMTCVIFGLIYIFIKPVQRGFFCDDISIQYPFRQDTIPMWVLAIYGGLVPIIIFFIVEMWVVRPFNFCRTGSGGRPLRQRQIDYLKIVFHTVFLFILGISICFLITEVGKRTIGRLRPYYVTICNPIWANLNCTKSVVAASGPIVIPQYIINHNCNSSAAEVDLQEAKLSFPSGHSSYSTYAFVFLFVYFEARLVCKNIQFLKPFLQCLCIAIAFFTCLSRVTDYKHHATDVIGGALIGFCIAVFSAVRVGTYLWELSVYCETEEETKKDRLPKEERVTIPGVETKQSGALRTNQLLDDQPSSSAAARARNGNRSDYDNVASIQPQHRAASNLSKTTGRSYEEANV